MRPNGADLVPLPLPPIATNHSAAAAGVANIAHAASTASDRHKKTDEAIKYTPDTMELAGEVTSLRHTSHAVKGFRA